EQAELLEQAEADKEALEEQVHALRAAALQNERQSALPAFAPYALQAATNKTLHLEDPCTVRAVFERHAWRVLQQWVRTHPQSARALAAAPPRDQVQQLATLVFPARMLELLAYELPEEEDQEYAQARHILEQASALLDYLPQLFDRVWNARDARIVPQLPS